MFFLNSDDYTKIKEIISIFDKNVLNKFETELLNFCKPIIDNQSAIELKVPIGGSPVNLDISFTNFQLLFRNLMKVSPQTQNISNQNYFTNCIDNQLKGFSSGIVSFLQSDVILRYGNPSNYQRRVFDSFVYSNTNQKVYKPITFNPYVPNSLPTLGGLTTVEQSKQSYPNEWKTLETEVGFSTINKLVYTNNGSFITDFFVDNNIEFSTENIILCASLIKMYGTQKLKNPSITSQSFKQNITDYVKELQKLRDEFFNDTMNKVRTNLPNTQPVPEKTIETALDGTQSKYNLYETFKSLNDKWIAGSDYKTETLFEDFLFLDRASRNIGDTVLVDIVSLEKTLSNFKNESNLTQSIFGFITEIVTKNGFVRPMPLPAYASFYKGSSVDGVSQTSSESSSEFANNFWGTFLSVDYRDTRPKMICILGSEGSEHTNNGSDFYMFNDDSFDMRKPNCPLIEDPNGKQDWSLSNKCVGFTVDIGIRNQNIFQSFNVSQENGQAKSERSE